MPHASLLLVHGEERFLVDEVVRTWREGALSRQMDVEVFDAPAKLDALRRSVAEIPLLDPERSILVRDPPQLIGTARRGADSAETLASIIAERAPTTALCIAVHAKISGQSPVLAAMRRLGGTVEYKMAPKGRDLRTWLASAITRRGLRFPPEAPAHLLRVVGADLGLLSSELDKLSALAGERALSIAEVRRAVAGDEPLELWSVLEQLLGPSPAQGAAVLSSLLDEGRSSQHLLAILAGQLRDLLMTQAILRARGSGSGLAAELRVPDWRADRLVRQARTVHPAMVAAWLQSLFEADRRVKAGEIGDADALRLFGLHAARGVIDARAAAPPARPDVGR